MSAKNNDIISMLSGRFRSSCFDFESGDDRFQVSTFRDSALSGESVMHTWITLYPETDRLVGYAIRTSATVDTLEAFDADDTPLGTFANRDAAHSAIGAAYYRRKTNAGGRSDPA